jgi:hypothetical protein
MNGNLSVYNGYDPDSLYDDGSITFYFVPRSGKLHLGKYPETHHDLLYSDEVYDDVFHDHIKLSGSKPPKTRNSAVYYGHALLGRFAIDGSVPLFAFWNSRLTKENIGAFIKAFYEKFPTFKQFGNEAVLILPRENPITVAEFFGLPKTEPSPEREVRLNGNSAKATRTARKSFEIGGETYDLTDLQAMRAAVHSQSKTDPVLCHPDLAKYHELRGYRPVTCDQQFGSLRPTHPQRWRQKGREAGVPYLYTPEHDVTFLKWLSIQESVLF